MLRGALIILALLVPLGCSRVIKEQDLFHPRKVSWTTDALQRRNVEVLLPTGERLRGWHLVHPEPRATVIFFYGNVETASAASGRLWRWAEAFRWNVLCVDYRGYGFSEGAPGLRAIREDALRVFDATADLRRGMPTLVAGYSIGTVPAVNLAASRPVGGLLLLAPVSTFEDVLPVWNQQIPWYARPFLRLKADPALELRPAPLDDMAAVRCPVLLVHGDADKVVPHLCSEKLLAAAGSARAKAFVRLAGQGHNEVSPLAPEVRGALDAWLIQSLRPEP